MMAGFAGLRYSDLLQSILDAAKERLIANGNGSRAATEAHLVVGNGNGHAVAAAQSA